MSRESLRVALNHYSGDVAAAFDSTAQDGWVPLSEIPQLLYDIGSKILTFDLLPAIFVFGPNFKKRPSDTSV